MWQRLSKARQLWRFDAAASVVQRVWPHVEGLEWSDAAFRTPATVARMLRMATRQRGLTPAAVRQHEPAPHRLPMNKGRCLLVIDRHTTAHGGGARIEGRSRVMSSTTNKGLPQCLQMKAGARVADSLAGTSTLAFSAARAAVRHSLRLPLASSP